MAVALMFPASKRVLPLISKFYYRTLANKPVELAYNIYEENRINNRPIFILHGLLGSKANWNSLAKAINLQTGSKIITLDARNHGASPHHDEFTYAAMVDDLLHAIKKHGYESIDLMGHSMGGRTAMLTALKYPQYVDRLIVVDISPIQSSVNLHGMIHLLEAMKDLTFDNTLTIAEGRKKASKELSTTIHDEGLRNFLLTNLSKTDSGFSWRINLKTIIANFTSNIAVFEDITGRVFDKPTLFIAGANSDYMPPAENGQILKIFPRAKFVSIQNAGHWVHAEQPQEFLKAVKSFLTNS